jgi:flagellar hook-associated protein 3 FlgL
MTFSRLSTANTYDTTLRNLQARQNTLSNLQESLTSGKKINSPSDDPTAAGQAERALNRIARIATDQRALEAQRNSIAQAEGTLGDITSALQDFRELLVSAGNGIHSPAERKTIAVQLSGLKDRIFALANTKDANNQPIFAALGSALTPFVGPAAAPPDYTFDGLPGQSSTGPYAIPFTLDGESAFMSHPARDGTFNTTVGSLVQVLPPPVAPAAAYRIDPVANGRGLIAEDIKLAQQIPVVPVNEVPYRVLINTSSVSLATGKSITTVTYDVFENPVEPFDPTNPASPALPGGPYTAVSNGNGEIDMTGIPGITFKISGTPAANDVISLQPSISMFSVMDNAIQDIGNAANGNAATQAVGQALTNIDISMQRVSAIRGQAGDLLVRADSITNINSKRNIEQEGNRSRAEDVDMVKAISDFNLQQTGYQAALQSYAQVQKLSLFNFIG